MPEVHSLHDKERDYAVFDNTQKGCFSDSVGRKGVKQINNLYNSQEQHNIRPVGRGGGAGGCTCTPLFYSSTLKLYSTTARNIPTLVASTL